MTKVLESKESPYASTHGKSSVQGNVVTIVLSQSNGSEISVQNTTKPISIRLTRPVDKRPKPQQHHLKGTSFQYHKMNLPRKQMTLSIYISPNSSPLDIYGIYVSFHTNESLLEPPTESKFDLLFVLPNKTTSRSTHDEDELTHTILMPPHVHLGNGTYIFGVKLISKSFLTRKYRHNMYQFRYQFDDESNRI